MNRIEEQSEHQRLRELCALATTGTLSTEERFELEVHLRVCESCRLLCKEFATIGQVGMAFLAGNEPLSQKAQRWDNRPARQRLTTSIQNGRLRKVLAFRPRPPRRSWVTLPGRASRNWAVASLAACLILAVALGAYRAGERKTIAPPQAATALLVSRPAVSLKEDASSGALLAKISRLEQQIASSQQDLDRLRAASSLAEQRVKDLESTNSANESMARQLGQERDKLANQLVEAEKSYQILQSDFVNLKAEHIRSLLHTASLESENTNLKAAAADQVRRLNDDEQFLSSDRDIRELMGARKLYIADVFDVDSISHTRKPFGRVFYTENKSLVFYAFDLDHQPGVKNASVFQVWGQRDAELNRDTHPLNLGILYMDSESNRRWVLRSDDPKHLAEIDAVFVTVEPRGGSQKPTGKPLLYALLRKEANHP
ncbi:MAG: hypothetical protein ABR905_17105 [Terracidiphilus sp.]|jgi:anti-sigma-K factor RskA